MNSTLFPNEITFPFDSTTFVVVSFWYSCDLCMVSKTSFVFLFSSLILLSSASICATFRDVLTTEGTDDAVDEEEADDDVSASDDVEELELARVILREMGGDRVTTF
jgi:hypothetical protein